MKTVEIPTTCRGCNRSVKIVSVALLSCECFLALCLQCAFERCSQSAFLWESGLVCPQCSEPSLLLDVFGDGKRVAITEASRLQAATELLFSACKQAATRFSISFTRDGPPTSLILAFRRLGYMREEKWISGNVPLRVAQLHIARVYSHWLENVKEEGSSTSSSVPTPEAGGLPWGPLDRVGFQATETFRKSRDLEGEVLCDTCRDVVWAPVLNLCRCRPVLCQYCIRQSIAAQELTFYQFSCPICNKSCSRGVRRVREAAAFENSLILAALKRFNVLPPDRMELPTGKNALENCMVRALENVRDSLVDSPADGLYRILVEPPPNLLDETKVGIYAMSVAQKRLFLARLEVMYSRGLLSLRQGVYLPMGPLKLIRLSYDLPTAARLHSRKPHGQCPSSFQERFYKKPLYMFDDENLTEDEEDSFFDGLASSSQRRIFDVEVKQQLLPARYVRSLHRESRSDYKPVRLTSAHCNVCGVGWLCPVCPDGLVCLKPRPQLLSHISTMHREPLSAEALQAADIWQCQQCWRCVDVKDYTENQLCSQCEKKPAVSSQSTEPLFQRDDAEAVEHRCIGLFDHEEVGPSNYRLLSDFRCYEKRNSKEIILSLDHFESCSGWVAGRMVPMPGEDIEPCLVKFEFEKIVIRFKGRSDAMVGLMLLVKESGQAERTFYKLAEPSEEYFGCSHFMLRFSSAFISLCQAAERMPATFIYKAKLSCDRPLSAVLESANISLEDAKMLWSQLPRLRTYLTRDFYSQCMLCESCRTPELYDKPGFAVVSLDRREGLEEAAGELIDVDSDGDSDNEMVKRSESNKSVFCIDDSSSEKSSDTQSPVPPLEEALDEEEVAIALSSGPSIPNPPTPTTTLAPTVAVRSILKSRVAELPNDNGRGGGGEGRVNPIADISQLSKDQLERLTMLNTANNYNPRQAAVPLVGRPAEPEKPLDYSEQRRQEVGKMLFGDNPMGDPVAAGIVIKKKQRKPTALNEATQVAPRPGPSSRLRTGFAAPNDSVDKTVMKSLKFDKLHCQWSLHFETYTTVDRNPLDAAVRVNFPIQVGVYLNRRDHWNYLFEVKVPHFRSKLKCVRGLICDQLGVELPSAIQFRSVMGWRLQETRSFSYYDILPFSRCHLRPTVFASPPESCILLQSDSLDAKAKRDREDKLVRSLATPEPFVPTAAQINRFRRIEEIASEHRRLSAEMEALELAEQEEDRRDEDLRRRILKNKAKAARACGQNVTSFVWQEIVDRQEGEAAASRNGVLGCYTKKIEKPRVFKRRRSAVLSDDELGELEEGEEDSEEDLPYYRVVAGGFGDSLLQSSSPSTKSASVAAGDVSVTKKTARFAEDVLEAAPAAAAVCSVSPQLSDADSSSSSKQTASDSVHVDADENMQKPSGGAIGPQTEMNKEKKKSFCLLFNSTQGCSKQNCLAVHGHPVRFSSEWNQLKKMFRQSKQLKPLPMLGLGLK